MDCGCFHGYDLHGSGFSYSISSALGEDTMMKAVEGLMGIKTWNKVMKKSMLMGMENWGMKECEGSWDMNNGLEKIGEVVSSEG